jgi:hypothetical protein
MPTPESIRKKVQRLEDEAKLQACLDQIATTPATPSMKRKALGRIMLELAANRVKPQVANRLTKAIDRSR